MQLTHKIYTDPQWLDEKTIRLPKIGDVAMAEALRFEGKILGATVSRTADNAPKPLKAALRRLKIRSRCLSRKLEAARCAPGAKFPKGTRLLSNNHRKSAMRLARLHACIASVRADFTHKLTTRLCRENQT